MVVMVMEVVKIDRQGRLIIPKTIREKKGLTGEVEIFEVEEGVILKSRKARTWDSILNDKLKVEWSKALAVSLEGVSVDDLLFG